MKKALKITAVVLINIASVALAIFIFFPGLPTYFKVKRDFPSIDRRMEPLEDMPVPESFKGFEVNGIYLEVPDGAQLGERGNTVKYNDETLVLVTKQDSIEVDRTARELAETYEDMPYSENPFENYLYEEEDYIHFFDSIDAEYPTIYNAKSSMLIWFMRDGFTSRDCLKLRGKDIDVFLEFAQEKEENLKIETTYKINGDGFTGMFSVFKPDGLSDIGGPDMSYLSTFYIYPDDDYSEYYCIMIKSTDTELKKQIASTVRLADGE